MATNGGVGPLDRFNRDNRTVANHHALANIEFPDSPCVVPAEFDVPPLLF